MKPARRLAMRGGDHLQPFGFTPPQLIADEIRWGQAPWFVVRSSWFDKLTMTSSP